MTSDRPILPTIARRIATDVPLMAEGVLASLVNAGVPQPQAAEHEYFRRLRESVAPKAAIQGDVAVVPIQGVMATRPDVFELLFLGYEDTDKMAGMVREQAANPDVRGILLDVDSPGGYFGGVPELSAAIRDAAKAKPVVAFARGDMASAAYMAASQADEIVASRSACVGSIGVYNVIHDMSTMAAAMGITVHVVKNEGAKFKAIGIPGAEVTEEQIAHLKDNVEVVFAEFRKTVRGKRPQVGDEVMDGSWKYGFQAKGTGLIDRVGDFDFAMSAIRSRIRKAGGR